MQKQNNMNKFKSALEKILKQEESFIDIDTKELNYNKVKDSADKIDKKLISILAENKETKEKFFTKIKDVYVFNTQDFKFFLDESKVDNSYTQYANKIGLSDNSGLFESKSEVVLDFPFKDCVLEGGQSTEEGEDTTFEYSDKTGKYEKKTAKRNEIFFNQILAQDEIDRLYDRKALVNWRRFTKGSIKDGEVVKEIKRDKTGLIKESLIIKGNNLLALHSLKSEFAGKVKLVYIDPPYNTGNDSFAYNDNFNHSTWLIFMKNRLEVARDLLSEDGSIFISIDNNEVAYLQVLLDELFGVLNKKNLITVRRSAISGAKVINPGLVNVSEFILVYSKDSKNWKVNRVFREKERDTRYSNYIINFDDPCSNWKFCTVLDAWAESLKIEKTKLKKHFGDLYEEKLESFYYDNSKKIFQFVTLDENSVSDEAVKVKNKSIKEPSKIFHIEREGKNDYYIHNGKAILFLSNKLVEIDGKLVFSEPLSDIWNDVLPNDLHTEGGVSLKKGKKPEKLMQRILELATNENDIVLDYHAGSGTTCAVAHKMNRQWIGIEQLNYLENNPEERMKLVVSGDDTGISKQVKWNGGGSFIYVSLAKWNEQAKEEIQNAKNLTDLTELFDTLYERYFLNYNVKIKNFKEKIIKEENFKKLTLTQQKKMFLTMLDLNQMYVNESEMADKKYGIRAEDQKLTKSFYSKK
jgi:adenine-specific DNA-methyltransferase